VLTTISGLQALIVGGEGNGADLEEEENGKDDANHAADKNKRRRRAHRVVGERIIGGWLRRTRLLVLHVELDLADR
jgi:hypothetical protein